MVATPPFVDGVVDETTTTHTHTQSQIQMFGRSPIAFAFGKF